MAAVAQTVQAARNSNSIPSNIRQQHLQCLQSSYCCHRRCKCCCDEKSVLVLAGTYPVLVRMRAAAFRWEELGESEM